MDGNNSTLRERMKTYLRFKGISQGKFADSIGVSSGYVNAMGNNLRSDLLDKILVTYPDLSKNWLLYGAGSMTKQSTQAQPQTQAETIQQTTLNFEQAFESQPTPIQPQNDYRADDMHSLVQSVVRLSEALASQSENYKDSLLVIKKLVNSLNL